MELMKEISSAFQLLSLLCALFWSLNLNLPSDFDPFQGAGEKYPKARDLKVSDDSTDSNSKDISETLKKLSTAQSPSRYSSSKILLPPFYTWMQEELLKQEASLPHEKKDGFGSASSRRKLNYASSKCGAKILSSNPEASHKAAILNENFEYMLNPCRAKTWFVIELCDTIEATQIELANYELYSSSPKQFSIFWSNIYPPQQWRHLGNFEAKDQRTMQTYNLTTHNYGKFLKVLILSHYGKEHFCPISVLRVLGYSMIYEYEDLEQSSNPQNKSSEKANPKSQRNHSNSSKPNENNVKTASPKIKDMNSLQSYNQLPNSLKRVGKKCKEAYVGFLNRITPKAKEIKYISTLDNSNLLTLKKDLVGRELIKLRFKSNGNIPKYSEIFDEIVSKYTRICLATSYNTSDSGYKKDIGRDVKRPSNLTENNTFVAQGSPMDKNQNSNTFTKTWVHQGKSLQKLSEQDKEKTCVCDSNYSALQDAAVSADMQSAALIQKESVITKLTNRIKDSEGNLYLINQYLQQLSESYRQEMDNMQLMISGAMKAVVKAEEKSALTAEQRQVSVRNLENKMISLHHRVEYFIDGHQHLLKRVLEMHGLFLLLEFIIISTIFSIFINNFKQKITNTLRNFEPHSEEKSHYWRN